MDKWTYHMVFWGKDQTEDEILTELDRLGGYGWELVGIVPAVTGGTTVIFVLKKREDDH